MNPLMIVMKLLVAFSLLLPFQIYGAATPSEDLKKAPLKQTFADMINDFLAKAQSAERESHGIHIKSSDQVYHGAYDEYYIKAIPTSIYEEDSPQEAALHSIFDGDLRVVPIYAHTKSDKYDFIVTKKAPLGDLLDYLESNYWEQKKQVPEEVIRILFSQMIDIAEMVHLKGVSFNDFKEENFVVMDDQPTIALIDFGAATPAKEFFSQESKGTLMYLSPEKCAFMIGELSAYFANEADVWSLGIILYRLMNRYPPFYENEDSYKDQISHFKAVSDRIQSQEEADLIGNIYKKDFKELKEDGIAMNGHSLSLQHLVFSLLNKHSALRMTTIEQIKAHPWMNGQVTVGGGFVKTSALRTKKRTACQIL